ncbi:hypothetical protein PISMIDRAFT_379025 [Pisolithus microcarpus 441]|uniref:Uncharacterized protein n=1 Tax=Pisolithus microcarpus 441 TaxID=765257 RepID=A0A0C9XMS6_9AGAM|nr:hypothetical protein PISMIDRAFT_379025 [Pisolithus microcarpus 441]
MQYSFRMTLLNDHWRNKGLTGTFLFASTTSRTSNELLGWNCGYALFSNIMYGVLYAISSEIFPAIHRGTGNCLTSTAKGVFRVMVGSSCFIVTFLQLSQSRTYAGNYGRPLLSRCTPTWRWPYLFTSLAVCCCSLVSWSFCFHMSPEVRSPFRNRLYRYRKGSVDSGECHGWLQK